MAMDRQSYKNDGAGPLFNPIEREEMANIATLLEKAGYSCFLPQKDGLEFAQVFPELLKKGISSTEASEILNKAIFSLDVFQIISSAGLVLNMNGRVPDEGAMVEAGIAWAHKKVIVIYKNDTRSLINGICNPLVMGLSEFQFATDYNDIPKVFDSKFAKLDEISKSLMTASLSGFDIAKEQGKTISDYLAEERSVIEITDLLMNLFMEQSCQHTQKYKTKQHHT